MQGFDNQKLKKLTAEKNLIFLNQKLQFTYPQAFIKDVRATEEAFIPQKRTSSTSKREFSELLFLFLWVIFALLVPNPILNPDLDTDTDPLT